MRIEIESTGTITLLDEQRCRVWKGRTEAGVQCLLFVRGIQVLEGQHTEFVRELDALGGIPLATIEADALWRSHIGDQTGPQ